MLEFATAVATETATVLYEGSFYILVGFVIAGILHVYLPADTIARHLGGDNLRSVVLAALFGAPIPLCSCGVVPTAAALRTKGASRASTLSFLISTPETGVDSIALTYGLLGPVMAVVRPVVAIVTAIAAGIASIALGDREDDREDVTEALAALDTHDHDHDHADGDECAAETVPADSAKPGRRSPAEAVAEISRYGFVTLLDELAFWIIIGFGLTGLLGAMLPDDFFGAVLGWDAGIVPMIAMLLVGAPLYLCASASTPVAAALIAKGLSPGAALVFLLAGPATNAATMTVVGKLLGAKRLQIYLGSIVVVSLAAGLLLDAFASDALRTTALSNAGTTDSEAMRWIKTLSAVLFSGMLLASIARTGAREGIADLRNQVARVAGGAKDFEWRWLMRGPVLAVAAAIALAAAIPEITTVVGPGHRGIVERFGRVVEAELEPGLYFHLPRPFGRGRTVDVGMIRQVAVGYRGSATGRRSGVIDQAFYLTADENIIDMRAVAHYRVVDPARFALGIEAADERVRAFVRRELVDTVGRKPIDKLYTTDRAPTEATLLGNLRKRISSSELGLEVLDLRLLDVHAPADVHDAFRDIGSAIEDRERSVKVAEGYAAEQTTSAAGAAAASLSKAHADAAGSTAAARGAAKAFAGIAAAHAEAPSITETRLYMETLERSLTAPRKYINAAGESGNEIDIWIGADTISIPPPAAEDRKRDPGAQDK